MKQLPVALFSLCIIFSACKKSDDAPVSPKHIGSVSLVDKSNHFITNISGVTAYVENSNPRINVSINSKGEFEFPGFKNSDDLELVFEKEGYGTVSHYYSKSNLDSMIFQNVALFPKTSVVLNSFSGTLEGEAIKLKFSVSAPPGIANNGVTYLVQVNNPEVSYAKWPGADNTHTYSMIPVVDGDNAHTLCLKCSKDCGFVKSGDVLFIRAYADIFTPFSYVYFDPLDKRMVFPSINTNGSAILSFLVP